MAFVRSAFGLINSGNGPSLFIYKTADLIASAQVADYFGPVARDLVVGSRILLNAGDGFVDLSVASVGALSATVVTGPAYA